MAEPPHKTPARKSNVHLSEADHLYPEIQRRQFQRFRLKCPVSARFQDGDGLAEFEAESENVSSGGLLLKTSQEIPLHMEVSLVMHMRGITRPLQLLATGKIVRVVKRRSDSTFALAVKFSSPISEIKIVMGRVVLKPTTMQ